MGKRTPFGVHTTRMWIAAIGVGAYLGTAFAGGTGSVSEMTCEYFGAGMELIRPCTRYMSVDSTSTSFEFGTNKIEVEGDFYKADRVRINGRSATRNAETPKCFDTDVGSERFCFVNDPFDP